MVVIFSYCRGDCPYLVYKEAELGRFVPSYAGGVEANSDTPDPNLDKARAKFHKDGFHEEDTCRQPYYNNGQEGRRLGNCFMRLARAEDVG